jgi:pimeloyl-ACP methyl ester carboxylesterase
MSSSPSPQTIYLDGAPEPVYATFHAPEAERAHATVAILCPPFGWDEVSAYRSLREWAQRLAKAGYPCIRLSFPGTGDSGGTPRDPDRLEAWTEAVECTARWVRTATGAQRAVAIGMGLGGIVAYRAAAAGALIDDLVLWATPARARALVRQLRTFSKLEESEFFRGLEHPPPLPSGELEAGGFLLSTQTVQELDAFDLTALPLPAASSRRALLLERDGIGVDAQLRDRLAGWGVAVTVAPGPGYGAMTSHPQRGRPPLEVIERVTKWLDEASVPAARAVDSFASLPAGASYSTEIRVEDSAGVKETPVFIEQSFGRLAGVLVEPLGSRESDLCAVLLNAGAVRRIGPSRMWVEAARRWAQRGVPTLRLDVEGIGDADGDEAPYSDDAALYVPELVPQVLAAIDDLHRRGIGERFVLGGLCAGAYWALHAAVQDPRVSAILMLNPRALIWDPSLTSARDFRALVFKRSPWSKIRRSVTARRVRALIRWMLAETIRRALRLRRRAAREPAEANDLDTVLERLHAAGTRALIVFSDNEPLHEELVRSGRMARLEQWPSVTVNRIHVLDHSLRPNWAQRQVHEALDRALDRELAIGVRIISTPYQLPKA